MESNDVQLFDFKLEEWRGIVRGLGGKESHMYGFVIKVKFSYLRQCKRSRSRSPLRDASPYVRTSENVH